MKSRKSNLANSWRRALLTPEATLQDSIRNLDQSGLQIVLVVTAGDILVGTVTDGDIRRGLLRGCDMSSPIGAITQREPLVVPPQLGREVVLHLMQANRIHQLPVVDEGRRVVGVHLLGEIVVPAARSNLMVVMAGGQGTRLRPHTENCPKPLLPVSGKPMLEHIVERARADGFNRFVFAVHYLGHMIEDYFGNGERWQVNIEYLREESPLGTAGALALLPSRPDAPFVVTNGDVMTDIRYSELLGFHSRYEASATMAVRLHEWQHPFGVVRSKGVGYYGHRRKPVDAHPYQRGGIYALEPSALNALTTGEHCDMPSLFLRLKESSERAIIYPIHEPGLDVARPEDYRVANGKN